MQKSKRRMLLEQSDLPDTDYLWGSALDAAFFTAIVQRLSTPITQLPAFQIGIINQQGKVIRNPKTRAERRAFSFLDQLALFIRVSAGGRAAQLYNMYRKSLVDPEFMKAAARSRSYRFLNYYNIKNMVAQMKGPIIGSSGTNFSNLDNPFG